MVTWDNATRLVTLSACETGVADIAHAPSEFTGLSSGWLRTGAIAVISSLWLVDDLCTMLLMERLYQGLVLSSNRSASTVEPRPDAALRAAQLWLKELTCGEVGKRLAALQQQPGLTSELHDMISLRHEEFSSQPSSRKPFSQPYWWAGFLCSGA
jgi:CHAT domain-containing protein